MADVGGAVFTAIADPTRRQILQDLGAGELAAGEIASRFPISGPSVSRHLSVPRAAGLALVISVGVLLGLLAGGALCARLHRWRVGDAVCCDGSGRAERVEGERLRAMPSFAVPS